MFYTRLQQVLKDKKITASRLAQDLGINRSTVSSWKSGGYTPRGPLLQDLASYLGVPVSFLLGTGVFEPWDAINAQRGPFVEKLVAATGLTGEMAQNTWGVPLQNPNAAPLTAFVAMLNDAVRNVEVVPLGEGGVTFIVTPQASWVGEWGTTNTPEKGEANAYEEFGKRFFAAYGNTPETFSEEELRDLAKFAKFIKEQEGRT